MTEEKKKKLDFKTYEKKWEDKWEEEKIYSTPKNVNKENKFYILPQLPYPSGAGLHVGHAEVYTACDIYSRFKRMKGKKVLQVIGWDSFGLPAENYAIKSNIHPKITTNKAVENFKYQIKRMGVSLDWDRSVGSHEPSYYKWTQWFFLLMLERGLAYKKKQRVNWCKSCKTVLANEQVTNGICERCDTEVIQKEMDQWFLKITDYADRLIDDLDKVDWPEESVQRQREWIGRSQGAMMDFEVEGSKKKLKVFTTRPDTIYGATFMVIAPEHELIKETKDKIENYKEVEEYIKQASFKTELERQQQEKDKTGIELKGIKAINPVSGEKMPIFVADYVLISYGTGSIMAVPAHDERDFEFAKKHGLEVKQVIKAKKKNNKEVYDGEGELINSELFSGLSYPQDKGKIIKILEDKGVAKEKTVYKLRDWSISRQRFWGAPIPIVYDPEGKPHPAKMDDLPIKLPDDVDFHPTGRSPIADSKEFQKGVEEKYGKGWKRETDTLDTFMCSSWYYYRYLDPKNDKAFASKEVLETWMPIDFYLGGPEHVTGHLLYSRFFTKVLHDAGYVKFDEPFMVHRHQGLILGEDNKKMSKRWDNIVNPTEVMDRHGGDTLRLYEMFMGPLEQAKAWNTNDEKGIFRFINRIWVLLEKVDDNYQSEEQERWINKTIKKVEKDIEELGFNTAIAFLMELINFFKKEEKISKQVWEKFLLILSPFAPFMTEEMWNKMGNDFSIHQQPWPKVEEKYLKEDTVSLVIQVNGKTRGLLEVKPDIKEEEAIKLSQADQRAGKYLKDGHKKVIYIPNRIINFVI